MKNILLFNGIICVTGLTPWVDLSCPDYDLYEICRDKCIEVQVECIISCTPGDPNYSNCIADCAKAEIECVYACPCDSYCPNGCNGCDNWVCQDCFNPEENRDWNQCIDANSLTMGRCVYDCQNDSGCETDCLNQFKTTQNDCPCETNCADGCPCESYECEQTTTTTTTTTKSTTTTDETLTTYPPSSTAVLMLSTFNVNNIPMVIDFNGNMDDDIDFTFGPETSVHYSCSSTLKGQFWVFGGTGSQKKQLSRVSGCSLQRWGDMDFSFDEGSCNPFNFPDEKIMLCFDNYNPQKCYTFDGSVFKESQQSQYNHQGTHGLANYKGSPFITGSYDHSRTETFDIAKQKWQQGAIYPFSASIYRYAIAFTPTSVFILGGIGTGATGSKVAEYRDDAWLSAGELNQGRLAHGAISSGADTMILGGYTSDGTPPKTELWQLDYKSYRLIEPTLPNGHYYRGLGLFLVEPSYCKKKT